MSPVRSPEIAELRTFCLAADLGTLGRAALRLNTSQPALSKRLIALEALAGRRLLDRSPRGVALTEAGRRLYEPARRVLEHVATVDGLLDSLAQTAGPVVLAASHSATDAFVGDWIATQFDTGGSPVELVSANSQVVRRLVAEGRAELGVAASRTRDEPNPGVHELPLLDDEIVYAVPRGHPWARRPSVSAEEFSRTPAVVRDPASNARWTVEAALRRHGAAGPPILAQAATPAAAKREALDHGAPVLLSRHILATDERFAVLPVRGLRFPRRFELVLTGPAPSGEVQRLSDDLRAYVQGR
jgi:DNA-binding transcriptional LysR family regulator